MASKKDSQDRRGKAGETLDGAYIDARQVWDLFEEGRRFKESIGLYDTVEVNENFFIGKQWEGVQANGLPTPVFNILKRDVSFVVASITTDNLAVKASPLAATADTAALREPARILNEEFERLFDQNHLVETIREFTRDAAVRGDGCLYSYWDGDAETGQAARGTIRTEVLENTRVHFGNPNDRRVESQPYILIERRALVDRLRETARQSGCPDWEDIQPDEAAHGEQAEKQTGDKVTCLLLLWKQGGQVWACEATRTCLVRPPWPLGIRLYPLVWLNWDYIADCCHGQAMLTGLIPNQIFINRMWAMCMLSLMTTAYPKVIYDKTKIQRWSNRVGEAVPVLGGDISGVARILEPAQISPQAASFISLAIEQTNQSLGATNVALGDAKPDNTSAIVALQRAAATPSEITKQNLKRCVEALARIYLEFIAGYYGQRLVDLPLPETLRQSYAFAGLEVPERAAQPFDFSQFRTLPMGLKIEVGASAYYSEIAAIQTLDNLLAQGHITAEQYLKRLPDGYVPDRQGLVDELARARQQAEAAARQQARAPAETEDPDGSLVRGGNEEMKSAE